MPRVRRAQLPDAVGQSIEGTRGVLLVERTVRVLAAFDGPDPFLPLHRLAQRASLHPSTALRIARTLAIAGYLVQRQDGHWRLGPEAGRLGARYQQVFDVHDAITPLLRELARSSGESASFFVRDGDARTCLLRVEGSGEDRPAVPIGTRFPLAQGAPGRVILAFGGQPGEPYESIRRRGYHVAVRERGVDAASVAAPVFGPNRLVVGAISLSGPASRLTAPTLERHASRLMRAARQASVALGGHRLRVQAVGRPHR